MPRKDVDQLLHAARLAAGNDDHTTAMQLLKQAAETHTKDAEVAYALGAEYGYVELFDAAEAQMQRALALNAKHHAARFHLGLLMITRSRFEEAMTAWMALETLPDTHALKHFKKAFDALAGDDFGPARALFDSGLKAKGSTPEIDEQIKRLSASLPDA